MQVNKDGLIRVKTPKKKKKVPICAAIDLTAPMPMPVTIEEPKPYGDSVVIASVIKSCSKVSVDDIQPHSFHSQHDVPVMQSIRSPVKKQAREALVRETFGQNPMAGDKTPIFRSQEHVLQMNFSTEKAQTFPGTITTEQNLVVDKPLAKALDVD